jgi:GNAT superfamily N-acetyltransferase
VRRLLVDEVTVELAALVVDEKHRGVGCGKVLLKASEEWALEQGIDSLSLRSNIIRESAHSFYESLGYARVKTSYAFRKNLR